MQAHDAAVAMLRAKGLIGQDAAASEHVRVKAGAHSRAGGEAIRRPSRRRFRV